LQEVEGGDGDGDGTSGDGERQARDTSGGRRGAAVTQSRRWRGRSPETWSTPNHPGRCRDLLASQKRRDAGRHAWGITHGRDGAGRVDLQRAGRVREHGDTRAARGVGDVVVLMRRVSKARDPQTGVVQSASIQVCHRQLNGFEAAGSAPPRLARGRAAGDTAPSPRLRRSRQDE
jgi:hypothetical protein